MNETELLKEVALRAEFTLLEQRREFARGEIPDLDALEDALNAWKAGATDQTSTDTLEQLRQNVEAICQERVTPPLTRSRLRHALAGVDWRKAK